MPESVRYEFRDGIDFAEVEDTLYLAMLGAESIHGEVPARLEAGCIVDRPARACVRACSGPAGRDLNSLFCGYLRKEFGPSAFRIQRVGFPEPSASAA